MIHKSLLLTIVYVKRLISHSLVPFLNFPSLYTPPLTMPNRSMLSVAFDLQVSSSQKWGKNSQNNLSCFVPTHCLRDCGETKIFLSKQSFLIGINFHSHSYCNLALLRQFCIVFFLERFFSTMLVLWYNTLLCLWKCHSTALSTHSMLFTFLRFWNPATLILCGPVGHSNPASSISGGFFPQKCSSNPRRCLLLRLVYSSNRQQHFYCRSELLSAKGATANFCIPWA